MLWVALMVNNISCESQCNFNLRLSTIYISTSFFPDAWRCREALAYLFMNVPIKILVSD